MEKKVALETTTAVIVSPAIGGTGWQHARMIIVEYASTSPIILTCIAIDTGNGSYGPVSVFLPSTGGTLTKYKLSNSPGPNKWKLMWFRFSSTTTFTLNLDGFFVFCRDWGSSGPYKPMQPFMGEGGGG